MNNFIKDNVNNNTYEVYCENSFYIVKDIANKKFIRLNKEYYNIWKYMKCNNQNIKNNYCIKNSKNEFMIKSLNKVFDDSNSTSSNLKANIEIKDIDKFINLIYKYTPKFLFSKTLVIMSTILIIIEAVYFLLRYSTSLNNYNNYFIFIFIWGVINILIHELSHALVCKHYGREVFSAGFKIHYIFPMFYINTTDICMTGKFCRIHTSIAGVLCNGILGITIYPLLYISNLNLQQTILNCMFFSFSMVIFNLIPFMKLDGYYILSDLIGENKLIEKSKYYIHSILISDCLKKKLELKRLMYLIYYILDLSFKSFLTIQVFLCVKNKIIKGDT